MKCPFCLHDETKVNDSRDAEEGVRRRRECLKCKRRYTTYERAAIADLVVVKKDGRREPFSRGKLIRSLTIPCQKRPIRTQDIERIADQIELELRKREHVEVKSTDVGELIMSKLKQLDKVAYIRFAAVYREFADVRDFRNELKILLKA